MTKNAVAELENRRTRKGSVGSNPTPSATSASRLETRVTVHVTPGTSGASRRHQLDGLRAIAFLLVFWCHTERAASWAGVAGVRCFFALSGFLITGLILDDHRPAGELLRSFYWRRFWRIAPVYYVALAILWAAGALPAPWWHFAYLSNVAQYRLDLFYPWTAHFWTLAVEEQFYLLFPLVLVVMRRRPGLAIALGLVGSHAARVAFALVNPTYMPNLLLPVAAETLLWGAGAAWLLRNRAENVERLRSWLLRYGLLYVGYWAAASVVLGDPVTMTVVSYRAFDGTLDGAGWALIVLGLWTAPADSWARRALSWRPLVWVGSVSYGLYLFHFPILYWLPPGAAWGWCVGFPLTLVAAVVSCSAAT